VKELVEFNEGLQWRVDEGGTFVLGVTQGALDLAGAISGFDLADVDDEFEAGDWIGEIQGKNSLVEMLAPFALKVVERNEEVLGQPGLLEDDPTGDAWVLRAERVDG